MDYYGFGYIVKSCPKNLLEHKAAGFKIRCGVDKYERSRYLCIPNYTKTALVEYCLTGTVAPYKQGNCLVVTNDGAVNIASCSSFTEGCPNRLFRSSDLHQFPACLEINTEERCFYADPTCPKTRINDFSTSGYSNITTENAHENGQIPASEIAIIYFALVVAILAVISVGYLKMTKRRKSELAFGPGSYSCWKTSVSDDVSTLSDDEVAVLYCFLCSDSGPPDFTDKEWLDILNEILRIVSDKKDPVTSEEAHIVLNGLESRDFVWEDQNKITEDVKDEIMFKLALIDPSLPFYYSSYETSRKYLRSEGYRRKPREKCVVCGIDMLSNYIDYLLISRLQMNTLTHVTIEDGDILDGLYWILNVPKAISRQKQSKRKQFLRNLEHKGESAHCSGRSGDSVPHVKWLWNQRRPDIVRSCIGLYPHWDVYIINNKAYKKPSKYHKLDSDVRSLLYCLLFLDECMMNVNEDNYKPTLNKIREIYFKAGPFCNDISTIDLPKEIMKRTENKLMFSSKNIQHNVTG